LGLGRLQAWLRGVPSPHESRRSDRELLVEYGLQSSAILKPRVSRVKNTADHRSAGVPFFGLLLYAKKHIPLRFEKLTHASRRTASEFGEVVADDFVGRAAEAAAGGRCIRFCGH